MRAASIEHLWANPIMVKSARARMRPKHLLSWGVVVLTVTGFTSAITYLSQVEHELGTPEQAARWTLLPVIIVQAVILMLLGTGAVASGISQERDEGLLDYQRMTPMSPASKLLGYLFGLPAREYCLFALTLPFVGFGVVRGHFPLATVAHFYLIFFSSVLVYHMTGMAAGMVSDKPRRAGFIAQGTVLVLYFVLPNLSHLGLTFFEFLTIRPALFGLISEEIERLGGGVEFLARSELTALDSFRDIPFFGVTLHPSVYTLMVQGGLLVTLWTMVYRKWRDESALPFSKGFGFAFFSGASVFLLGSVWPILRDNTVLVDFVRHFQGDRFDTAVSNLSGPEVTVCVALLLAISAFVLGGVGILTLLCTTPSRHQVAGAWRRVARRGGRRVPGSWDGASSLWLMLGGVVVTVLTLVAAIAVAERAGRFEERPSIWVLGAPALYVGLILLFLQGTLERYGRRAFFVVTFLLWMVPFFTSVLLVAAFESEAGMGYTSLAFPPAGLGYMALGIMREGAPSLDLTGDGPQWIVGHSGALSLWAIGGYAVLAAAVQSASIRQHRRLRSAALEERVARGDS